MPEPQILASLIGAVAAISGTFLGGLFTWLAQRDAKQRAQDRAWIEKLEKEVVARIEEETVAVNWIIELRNMNDHANHIKVLLRDKTERESLTQSRPQMKRSDFRR